MFSHHIDEEIELRLLEERHAELLYALQMENKEHISRWVGWIFDEKFTVEVVRGFIKGELAKFSRNDGFTAGVWFQGHFAGSVGLNYINWPNRRTEIGYTLGAQFQGKGLASRSCRALLHHAFDELNLNRVEIRCASENQRACAVATRLGFKREGCRREAEWLQNKPLDHIIFGMLASEWSSSNYR